MRITKDILDQYVSDGWLISQVHPTLPLTIYNYSQLTQYESYWDEVTMSCRGLVMDNSGVIVARPFRKFFNLDEQRHTSTPEFEIYEKMDGSLGILFMYSGQWIFASRGSFTSDQAIKGGEIIRKYDLTLLSPGYTYLFEIIYPENRIVVNYGETEDVVLLGAIEITDGGEIEVHDDYYTSNFNVVKKYSFDNYTEIQKLNWENQEGFVVRFSNGERCKIKFDDYVKLHRILTNCSSYDVWENLMTLGKIPEDMLKDVPDEFYDWIHKTADSINKRFHYVYTYHIATISSIMRDGMLTRKDLAQKILSMKDVNHRVLFGLADGKDVSENIWKMVKPFYEKPFSEKKR